MQHGEIAQESPFIAILGAGAIGGTMAGYLKRSGADVVVIDSWSQHIEAIRKNGLHVSGDGEPFTVAIDAFHVDDMAKLARSIDIAVLATKGYDAEWGVRLIEPYLSDSGVIVVAQNGITEEWLSSVVRPEKLIGCAITNYPGECFVPGQIRRTPLGSKEAAFTIGELDGSRSNRVHYVARHLQPSGETKVTDNIWGLLWGKLVLNLMSNALGGITGFTTYQLWTNPDIAAIGVLCGAEAVACSDRLGIEMSPVFGRIPPADMRDGAAGDRSAWDRAVAELAKMGSERIGGSENKPSLLQDIMKGRRTEIDYLNGHVVKKAKQLGLAAPVNAAVAELLRRVERGELTSSAERVADLRAILDEHSPFASG